MKKSNVIVIDSYRQKDKKQRVCAYVRVSTDSNEQMHSFKTQLAHYQDLITSNDNWEFIDLYADEGLSGRSLDNRDELKRLMEDCRGSKIDRILVKSISRLARNTKESLEVIRELKALGVSIYFEKENVDTAKATDEFLLTLYSQIAQEESVSHSKNMKRSYKTRMEQGKFITQKAPFGYDLKDGTLVINEKEAELVRHIFNSYINGVSKQTLADELTAKRIKTTYDNTSWSVFNIDYIIKNEKYIGDALTQKKYTTDAIPSKNVRNHGEKPRYYLKNSHEPIIDRVTYDKAQRLNNLNVSPVCVGEHNPLNRKIYCDKCGATFKLRRNGNVNYRICRTHDLKAEACEIKQIRESEINNAFVRLFNKLQLNKNELIEPTIRMLRELRSRRNTNNDKVIDLNKDIADSLEQLNVLTELNTKGYIDSELYMTQTNELNTKIKQLKKDKNLCMDKDDNEEIASSKKLLAILKTFPHHIELSDVKILLSIVDKIIVISETEIRLRLINGFELTEHIERTAR
jgi:site-specific DNA recombinase